ncbi:hypothetical protein GI374_16215 [Paracoccus sp. S-4012]|uniref:hypothetical protein n=1 Tax=Paracoccus sp. S-4012 TaxID=2665648 RepID=UPI0012B11E61|nr:hypothetical protein [Paracoccus sp. S-4012]MRX51935.1 hypothetical protein [Paracoccus sp. S-4012]
MSNTEGNVPRSARRHRFAIWGIVAALVIAALAFLFFTPARDSDLGPGHDDPGQTSANIQTPEAAITPGTVEGATTAD